jgi:hypothetical protein
MKKIITLSALIIIFASNYAAATTLASNAVSDAGVAVYGGSTAAIALASTSPLFKLSTGVSAVLNADGAGIGYAIFTKHVKGTKVYGTAYDSTAISFTTVLPGIITTTTTGSATAVPSGWTTM